MIFETKRLILRPWTEDDAPILFMYASEPTVSLSAGWAPVTSEHESRRFIQRLGKGENYAIVLRETNKPIGNVGFVDEDTANVDLGSDDREVTYWIGMPHWGNGYAGEAVRALLRHAFEDLNVDNVWGTYYEGNVRSGRVLYKSGFVYHHTDQDATDAFGDARIMHYTYISELPPEDEQ